jgi:hypothetical protein
MRDRTARGREWVDVVLSAVVMAGYWLAAAGVAGSAGLRAGGPVREAPRDRP